MRTKKMVVDKKRISMAGHRFSQKLIFDQSDTITNILALHIINIPRILYYPSSKDIIIG